MRGRWVEDIEVGVALLVAFPLGCLLGGYVLYPLFELLERRFGLELIGRETGWITVLFVAWPITFFATWAVLRRTRVLRR